MNKMIVKIISKYGADVFEKELQQYLDDGWKLRGDMQTSASGGSI
jgi:hypothetical protein